MNGKIVNELKVCLRLWTVSTRYVNLTKWIFKVTTICTYQMI